jgi:hypothetical protein
VRRALTDVEAEVEANDGTAECELLGGFVAAGLTSGVEAFDVEVRFASVTEVAEILAFEEGRAVEAAFFVEKFGTDARAFEGGGFELRPGVTLPGIVEETAAALRCGEEPNRAIGGGERRTQGVIELIGDIAARR